MGWADQSINVRWLNEKHAGGWQALRKTASNGFWILLEQESDGKTFKKGKKVKIYILIYINLQENVLLKMYIHFFFMLFFFFFFFFHIYFNVHVCIYFYEVCVFMVSMNFFFFFYCWYYTYNKQNETSIRFYLDIY